jgi:superfamily II DNA or RNA helicase
MIVLRDYQQAVDDRVVDLIRHQGLRRVIVQGGTGSGSGKGICIGDLAKRSHEKGCRVLAVAHQRRLVKQLYDVMKGFDLPVGKIMAGESEGTTAPIICASRDTFVGWLENGLEPPPFNLILPDECRLFTTAVYQKIAKRYPNAAVVGFDATLARSNGESLGAVWAGVGVGIWQALKAM